MSLHSSLICMGIFLNLDILYLEQFQTLPKKNNQTSRGEEIGLCSRKQIDVDFKNSFE